MIRGFKVARVFGIDIAIHPSWFIILAVLVWTLADSVFPSAYLWSRATYWIVAVVSALLLFASVIVHELAHSLIAKHQGIPVKNITLFVLGGVSSLEEEPRSPGREALMAGAGPLSSLVLGGVALGVGRALRTPETARAILLYLGSVNILLGAFNLLPGFPLDGGRVLRAALWKRSGDMLRATKGAARTGTALGYLLIAVGVVMALLGSLLGGIWMAFVGWILTQASQAAYEQTSTETRLAGVRVRELITPARGLVPPDATVQEAADDYFRTMHARCLPVGSGDGSLAGVVCLSDLRHVDPDHWSDEAVADVMTPRERVITLAPEAGAVEALHLMARRDVNQLAVMDDGHLLGFVERGRLLHHGTGDAAERDDHDRDDEEPAEVAPLSMERRSADPSKDEGQDRPEDRSGAAA
jgi:Zn-dependent protease/CBS domain-containing protein